MLATKKFWKDVLIGTIFIFSFMWFASKFLGIFEFLDPVGEALEDMEITDQVFSNPDLRERPTPEDRITIVNSGRIGRGEIAQQINIINKYNPLVIGIDSIFPDLKEDSLGDMMLADALANTENLVLGIDAQSPSPDDDLIFYDAHKSHPTFDTHAEPGYVGLVAESAGTRQEELKIVRSFFPYADVKDTISGTVDRYFSMGIKLAEYLDPQAVEEFLARGNEEELVNYRGNIFECDLDNPFNCDFEKLDRVKYSSIDVRQLMNEEFDPSLIEGKIILIGQLGERIGEPYWIEDKFFTPMNEKYAGRADLDTFGVVIHANIASMVLDRDYLDTMSENQSVIVAIILCLLNVAIFTLIYRKLPLWYDGLTKLIQLAEMIIMLGLIVVVFDAYAMKLDLTYAIIAVLLAGDSLEVVYGVGYNLFDRKKRKVLFTTRS